MKSTGLGDSVEKFTKATGIKTMVDTISKGLNVPCGCAAKKGALNKIFPYWKGKKYSRADMEEGAKNLPWESEAYKRS